jgi:hypothetical protein
MVFGMPVKCGGCGRSTTCLFAAQYENEPHDAAYICRECYAAGKRCWVLQSGELVVSGERPEQSRPAVLYWDEGGYATGEAGTLPRTYPRTVQPEVVEPMTDEEFGCWMVWTVASKQHYRKQLRAVEAEYRRRFGYTPGELEDGEWLETFHADNKSGAPTVDQVTTSAEDHLKQFGLKPKELS